MRITLLLLLLSNLGFAQLSNIRGTVYFVDGEEQIGYPGAQVLLEKDGEFYRGAITDFDGMYVIGGLEAGEYTMTVSTNPGDLKTVVLELTINYDNIYEQNVELPPLPELYIEIPETKKPIEEEG